MKIPKSLGACADKMYEIREKRLKIQREVEELKKYEGILRDHIIANLPESDATGISGKKARVTIRKKTIAVIKDWEKFTDYVAKTKNFAFLTRKLSQPAIQEVWDNDEEVPGIGAYETTVLSVNKL